MPAHYAIVEGLRLPAKLGGHPVLDFCNTLTGWDGHVPQDYLRSYDHLAVWSGFDGLLPAEQVGSLRGEAKRRVAAAGAFLGAARDLRARLYEVLCNGPDAAAFELVAQDVHTAAASLRLRRDDQAVRWAIEPEAGLAAPIFAVAWSAGQLLASPDLAHIRACPGTGCGWLFLDRSGRRRWCTMATCGNREKARRHAVRARAAAPGRARS
jgi:predicted RNA-binding Zn ribbon-like protein